MLRLHKEGTTIIWGVAAILVGLTVLVLKFVPGIIWFWAVLAIGFFALIVQFFRNPVRTVEVKDNQIVYAPADGRVCVIEETEESEYFKGKRLQVSIFMSPLNVHVNRNPVSGIVQYFKYHPGKYLVAWHPKSSTENERTTVVYSTGKTEILMRQIAGALAKRIKWYIKEGDKVEQGVDMGFIKFGSRVDLYLPLGTKVEVVMDQQVKGNKTVIARLD
jgi:phosphatidylserine decarboxylase